MNMTRALRKLLIKITDHQKVNPNMIRVWTILLIRMMIFARNWNIGARVAEDPDKDLVADLDLVVGLGIIAGNNHAQDTDDQDPEEGQDQGLEDQDLEEGQDPGEGQDPAEV